MIRMETLNGSSAVPVIMETGCSVVMETDCPAEMETECPVTEGATVTEEGNVCNTASVSDTASDHPAASMSDVPPALVVNRVSRAKNEVNNGTKRKDERIDIFLVKIKSCNSI